MGNRTRGQSGDVENPVPLIIPCHRVLAAGGKVGDFGARRWATTKTMMLAYGRREGWRAQTGAAIPLLGHAPREIGAGEHQRDAEEARSGERRSCRIEQSELIDKRGGDICPTSTKNTALATPMRGAL